MFGDVIFSRIFRKVIWRIHILVACVGHVTAFRSGASVRFGSKFTLPLHFTRKPISISILTNVSIPSLEIVSSNFVKAILKVERLETTAN